MSGLATNCLRGLSESGDSTTSNAFSSRIFSDIYHCPSTPANVYTEFWVKVRRRVPSWDSTFTHSGRQGGLGL